MNIDFLFVLNSLLFGVGLSMDAFSVSLANGLNEPGMKTGKTLGIAGTFAFFQAAMPLLGWLCVATVAGYFKEFEKLIPWIALLLLAYIGGKMLADGFREKKATAENRPAAGTKLTFPVLIVQGIATSIDALSVGFDIASYDFPTALISSLIIAAVTFLFGIVGVLAGKNFGTGLSWKASLLGGVILIGIGVEIFVKGVFF